MAIKNSIRALPAANFDAAGLDATFKPMYVGGLPFPCALLRMVNASDVAIGISYGGAVVHDFLPSGGVLEISLPGVYQNFNGGQFTKGTQVYISSSTGAAGTGLIWLTGYSQEI